MTTAKVKNIINRYILEELTAYSLESSSTDASGTRIPHQLDTVDDNMRLNAINFGIKMVALSSIPLTLLEEDGSVETEFKRLSTNYFIREPRITTLDGSLDIDESLSYAVIYKALSFINETFNTLENKSIDMIASQNEAGRDYLQKLEELAEDRLYNLNNPDDATIIDVPATPSFIRYSSDQSSWHTNFALGDLYMSVQPLGGQWGPSIKFVGGEGTHSKFSELVDTPTVLTSGKFLMVGPTQNILEVDAPATEVIYDMDGDVMAGTILLDLRKENKPQPMMYIEMSADGTIDIDKNANNEYFMEIGRRYTIEILPKGFAVTIAFDCLGNKIIDNTKDTVILELIYDSVDILIVNNIGF